MREVYGRKINDHVRPGTPKHLYLPGPHRGVWNLTAVQNSKDLILCESLIDALTFWCAGYRNVTSSYGIEGFTADHLATLKAATTERVLIAYDRDDAGDAAATKLATSLLAEGFDCSRIQFPKGMDANEYARQVQPAAKSLGTLIRAAEWMGKGATRPLSVGGSWLVGREKEKEREIVSPSTTTLELAPPPLVGDSELVETNVEAHQEQSHPPLPSDQLEFVQEEKEQAPGVVSPRTPNQAPGTRRASDEQVVTFGDRRYRLRGLEKNLSYDVLKVNLLVSRPAFAGTGESVHVDTLDLYQARPRHGFITQAAVELGVKEDVIKADLGKLVLQLETIQDERIRALQEPKTKAVVLSDEETAKALDLLKSPDLLARIRQDFARCGLVGEETNKLVAYLAALSRKLDSPLAVTIQSSSAAGKSSLMDAVLAFVPEEDRIKYSAMTGQSLFYMGQTDLKHKVLAIVEEEGASQATYALKLLQSEGELTIASTGKDPVTGKLETKEYHVEGPVMIMLTTTAIELDEELLNRCLTLSIDEGRAQTQAIHAQQRNQRTLGGLLAKATRVPLLRLHQNAQRLLQPLAVMNPYAHQLTFVDDRTRMRRDHEKYLTLIESLALLHQYQRPIHAVPHQGQVIRYVEVTLDDIAMANQLAHEVLGRTLDELPPQTRKLLQLMVAFVDARAQQFEMARTDVRFSRRELRDSTRWGNTQLKIHLRRLEELEYVVVHRNGVSQRFVYELLYDGEGETTTPHLSGLIDVEALRAAQAHDANRSGEPLERSGSGRPVVGPQSGGGRGHETPVLANGDKGFGGFDQENPKNGLIWAPESDASYRRPKAVENAK